MWALIQVIVKYYNLPRYNGGFNGKIIYTWFGYGELSIATFYLSDVFFFKSDLFFHKVFAGHKFAS